MIRIILAAICLVIAGCATTANYEAKLKSFIGMDADAFIQRNGPPNKYWKTKDGYTIIEYVRTASIEMGGYTRTVPQYHSGTGMTLSGQTFSYSGISYTQYTEPSYNIPLICITTFKIDPQNKIVGWKWRGNNCVAY